MKTKRITGSSTMREVVDVFPWAPRALFLLHGIPLDGDLRDSPSQTLEEFCRTREVPDVQELIQFFRESEEVAAQMELSPQFVAGVLKAGHPLRLVDVRTTREWDLARLPVADLLTGQLAREIEDDWPRDGIIIFYCHHGHRSLNAAAYFLELGFDNVWSMAGGIDAWSRQVDPSVPRY